MSDARAIASRILTRITRERAFAAALIEAETNRLTDPRDAALCHELVLGVLRHRPWLDALLQRVSRRGTLNVDPQVHDILRVAAYQLAFLDRIPAHAAVKTAVDQVRHTPAARLASLTNALLRAISRMTPEDRRPAPIEQLAQPDDIALASGLPPWVIQRLIADRGLDATRRIAHIFQQPSHRFVRLNLHRETRDALLRAHPGLSAANARLPWSAQADDRQTARHLEDEGLAAIQDEGSGLVVAALGDVAHRRVLDACAGRGGKSGTLAMQMNGTGYLLCADKKPNKLERLRFDFQRQQLSAHTIAVDARSFSADPGGPFDRILVDAPCTGSGTMGRRPEIRWRLAEADIDTLAALQADMLHHLAQFVAPGGRLVFATCSLFAAEHTAHLAPFLARHPDFQRVLAPPPLWPADIPWQEGAPFIDPSMTGTDGYGILCFERRPAGRSANHPQGTP